MAAIASFAAEPFANSQCPDQRAASAFQLANYFTVKRIRELDISSDGALLAYTVAEPATSNARTHTSLFVMRLASATPGARLDAYGDAEELSWLHGTHELAFLAERQGRTQVVSLNADRALLTQRSHDTQPVSHFRFSRDGRHLAYSTTTMEQLQSGELQSATKGVIADVVTLNVFSFLPPTPEFPGAEPKAKLWLQDLDARPRPVAVPGNVREYEWSPEGPELSVVFVANDRRESIYSGLRTSVGVVHAKDATFRLIAGATDPDSVSVGLSYTGGEWLPSGREILLRRSIEPALGSAEYRGIDRLLYWHFPSWAAVDPKRELASTARWHPTDVAISKWFPVSNSRMYVQMDVKASTSLYEMTPGGTRKVAAEAADHSGSSSHFRFSDNFRITAFVNESLSRPPEIYVRDADGAHPRQVTCINSTTSATAEQTARQITWESNDGQHLQGWLVEPSAHRFAKPWPVITFLHGGPAWAYPDAYTPYFAYWPFPLELYARQGMAVFIPNYRGSTSFGRRIESPTAIDAEPVNDVISGIKFLIDRGIADKARLGIAGHSHGAWLGAMVMTRAKLFRAAALAEGAMNYVVNYELTESSRNQEYHEPAIGDSLYGRPERYLELSPDLHFTGVKTATLFEGASQEAALFMIGPAKAARRAGMPSEFVVYPHTAHNMSDPRLQRESAARTLDWFRYWLANQADPDPVKQGQFARWQMLRERACSADVHSPFCPEPRKHTFSNSVPKS